MDTIRNLSVSHGSADRLPPDENPVSLVVVVFIYRMHFLRGSTSLALRQTVAPGMSSFPADVIPVSAQSTRITCLSMLAGDVAAIAAWNPVPSLYR